VYRRIAADIIDYSFGYGFASIILAMMFNFIKLTGTNVVIDFVIIFLVFNIAALTQVIYQVIFIKTFGFTFGRYVMRVELSSKEAIFKREFYKWYLSYSTLFIYSVYCLYKISKNQCLPHEKKSNCYVL
jgi:hypothetical protein